MSGSRMEQERRGVAARSPGLENSDTYDRIAQAVEFVRSQARQQPSLAAIAQHIHLSESQCQRLFSRWVGISPKRFLQYLTVEYAKARLGETRSLLDLSLDAGLSSPARLHDLFVTLEALSPGEYRAGGRGLEIAYGLHSSPFGPVLIATTPRGVCGLQFLETLDQTVAEAMLRQPWPQATLRFDPVQTQPICDRLCHPLHPSNGQPLTVLVKGTNFQIQVWRALLALPWGGLSTYQDIAQRIGNPKAVRAVGGAIGANPVAYFIPCHRVIRASGDLGGYRWGLARKLTLLGWEATHLHGNDDTLTTD